MRIEVYWGPLILGDYLIAVHAFIGVKGALGKVYSLLLSTERKPYTLNL